MVVPKHLRAAKHGRNTPFNIELVEGIIGTALTAARYQGKELVTREELVNYVRKGIVSAIGRKLV